MLSLSTALLLAAVPAAPPAKGAPDLAPPALIQAGGKPLDVDVGHAAPCVADLKGDGTLHLLVGQFGEGKLRIYPNAGTKAEPRFDRFEWFRAGGDVGKVPAG